MKRTALALLLLVGVSSASSVGKQEYFSYIKEAAERGWKEYPAVIERWKQGISPSSLWGYDPPAQPIYLADVLGFLYLETKEKVYAERARDILLRYGDLRDAYPKDYYKTRIEYRDGMPAIGNFFFFPAYVRAYLRIRDSGIIDPKARAAIERELAHSANFVFYFPEWGAHNRTTLRAAAMIIAAKAMPNHPDAKKWRQLAETLASDSMRQWEIEDATIYHPIWLYFLFSYADVIGDHSIYESPKMHYYAKYFQKLLAPSGFMPDLGDASWAPAWNWYVTSLERLASIYKDPELKWVVNEIFTRARSLHPDAFDTGTASLLTAAYRWTDESVTPKKPVSLSEEVLDDIVGKKIVFRNGWEPTSTYLLLNYRDEGDGGWLQREYLRNTIPVEEEKMHHGHSDENEIIMLMSRGSVLLHGAGYRDALPSGPYGNYRADYFHNRLVSRKNKRDRYQTSLLDFVHNSGNYRTVRTRKIDFLTFREVEISRTRLIDDNLGYEWDRVITYVKDGDYFVVIDGIKVLRPDYFTFSNFWHTRKIISQGPHYYDTMIDSIQTFVPPDNKRLLIYFPETYAKHDSVEPERRHYQDELAIYQTQSSQYKAGDWEVFITVLIPHEKDADLTALMNRIRLLNVDKYPRAVGLELTHGKEISALCLKLDLEMEILRENIRPRYTFESGKVRYGEFETDAYAMYATVQGSQLRYSAASMVKVTYRGKSIFEALPNTFGLQLDGGPDRVGYSKWRFWEDSVSIP